MFKLQGSQGGIGREGEEGETKTGIDAIILNSGAVSRDFLLCSLMNAGSTYSADVRCKKQGITWSFCCDCDESGTTGSAEVGVIFLIYPPFFIPLPTT